MRRLSRVLLVTALLLAVPGALYAQARNARVSGSVVDRSSGAPLAGATVVFLGDGRAKTTDSTGAFQFDKLPMGIARFLVRATGFPAGALIVALAPGEVMEQKVELDSSAAAHAPPPPRSTSAAQGQLLAPVTVEAERSLGPRYASFERRKRTGSGQYVTREDIEKFQYSSLQDVARAMRGTTIECGGGGSQSCYIRMVRAPMRCLPEYIVDDNVDNIFGPTIPVRDIEALEVYTGPADVPGEYAGRNAGCGVIVIWSRSGPPRRKKK